MKDKLLKNDVLTLVPTNSDPRLGLYTISVQEQDRQFCKVCNSEITLNSFTGCATITHCSGGHKGLGFVCYVCYHSDIDDPLKKFITDTFDVSDGVDIHIEIDESWC